MPPAVPANHDPLSRNPADPTPSATQLQPPIQPTFPPDILNGIDPNQILNLLRTLPGFNKTNEAGNPKQDAAHTLSNLSQTPFSASGQHPYPGTAPGINDPGPSSHPRGPPNLGQLSALAMNASPATPSTAAANAVQPHELEEESEDGRAVAGGPPNDATAVSVSVAPTPATATRRGARSATMGSDEWSRLRKDNHKEVERRRRGNINEGINELGRIVPNGTGEKAKGAILSRAVQYIHHLKDNEARNIEKWTLEKLLMDQAMGDLQTQLEELKKAWENESLIRMRLEQELATVRAQNVALIAANAVGTTAASANNDNSSNSNNRASPNGQTKSQPSNTTSANAAAVTVAGEKRSGEDESGEKEGKRPRIE